MDYGVGLGAFGGLQEVLIERHVKTGEPGTLDGSLLALGMKSRYDYA
jgi:hypothetical protein